MASVASQLIDEVTAHAQSDSLEDARQMCADGTYFPNNLRIYVRILLRFYHKSVNNTLHYVIYDLLISNYPLVSE